jgi:diguanylate cyclase (GGDEF)-like protein
MLGFQMSVKLFSSQASLEQNVLKITSFFLAITGTGFTIVNFFFWDLPKFGVIDSVYTAICIYVYLRIEFGHYRPWHSALLISGLTALLIYSMAVADGYSVLVFWAFCFPALYHIFFNRYIASAITFAFYLVAISILASYPPLINSTPYTLINFTIPYFLIWAISFVHEDMQTKIKGKLSDAALLDPLTGAKNRLALEADTSNNPDLVHNHYLVHFDLDHFKRVNDNYGHAAGDTVLKMVAQIVGQQVHQDAFYRVGGEEFCTIFSAPDKESAFSIANALREKLSQTPISIGDQTLQVTLSGGLCELVVEEGIVRIDETMKITDAALYQAKAQGRNQIIAI